MFVIALTIREAWQDAPGGLNGPWCWWAPICWSAVCTSPSTRWPPPVTRGCGARSRSPWLPTLAGGALLVAGALLRLDPDAAVRRCPPGGGVGVYVTSRRGNWRLRSVAHLTNDTGCSSSWPSASRWSPSGWARPSSPSAPRCWSRPSWAWPSPSACGGCTSTWSPWRPSTDLLEARGQARVDLAVDAYNGGYFPLVAGIVLTALGVEGVLAHAGDREPLGAFALALFGGVMLYLAGQLLFKRRMHNAMSLPRLVTIGVLVAALPAAVVLPPLVALAGLVLVLAALIVVDHSSVCRPAATSARLVSADRGLVASVRILEPSFQGTLLP